MPSAWAWSNDLERLTEENVLPVGCIDKEH
ncbi:MAG: hypothetical protein AW10_00958 [Candidatus Accumulibacter appositus]|mgnify:CR=1 FL=1|uniref:Uncharacterized protein n=1 Tax=Candidatus Accumulibacter appositus TaxID=1454003 RepID=A0A011PXN3_9PROT|nr:MAG: hypothetical protein AW10_00958 [Candidatus Accumulibacter appositus]